MKFIIAFVTASSEEEAGRIADILVESGTAACVNIIPGVKSVFMWEGKKDTASEYMLIIKTSEEKFGELKKKVKEAHSYDVPEIISVALNDGDENYLNWAKTVLG